MVLRCFLDNDLPKTVSKGMIPLRRSLKKSKKHRAIAPAALGGCGGLGELWEALAELREMLLLRNCIFEVRKSPCGHVTAQKLHF